MEGFHTAPTDTECVVAAADDVVVAVALAAVETWLAIAFAPKARAAMPTIIAENNIWYFDFFRLM